MGSPTVKTKWFPSFLESIPSMEGKTVVITGTTSGTGFVAAGAMAHKGASIIVLNRKSGRAEKSLEELKTKYPDVSIDWVACDLQSFKSVKEAIGEVQKKCESGIDVLCNNAGIMAIEDRATEDGYDVQMQTNHLSHFLLTKELFPLLEKAAEARGEARVINHSSEARNLPPTPLRAKYFEKRGGNLGGNGRTITYTLFFRQGRWERYHQTKLANSVFTQELARRIKASDGKVKSLCCHPGFAITALQATSKADGGMGNGFLERFAERNTAQSQEDGAMPLIQCMAGKDMKNGTMLGPKNGLRGRPKKCSPGRLATKKAGKLLWKASEKACGEFNITGA